jgi:hypothetical protein
MKRRLEEEAGEFTAGFALQVAFQCFDLQKCSPKVVEYMAKRIKYISVPDWFVIDDGFTARWAAKHAAPEPVCTPTEAATVLPKSLASNIVSLRNKIAKFVRQLVRESTDEWIKSSDARYAFCENHPTVSFPYTANHFGPVLDELEAKGVIVYKGGKAARGRNGPRYFKLA